MSITTTLVVIDPTHKVQPAFARALVSARETGSRLHLLTCVYQRPDPSSRVDPELGRKAIVNEYEQRLQALVTAEGSDVDVTCEVAWDPEPVRAITQAAARAGAELIFKEAEPFQAAGRMFSQRDDWALLRTSPCPVLMVKGHRGWKSRRILAAVNLLSEDDSHQRLNNLIIGFAKRFAENHGAEAHVVHAYSDSLNYPDRSRLVSQTGLPGERIHVRAGAADEIVVETARALEVDLVLIGTVGRRGVSGLIIGNTAEKVLDQVDCDVMVLN